ncbi:MAG: response regulator transcription factor [Saccharofermentanales bacterium]|nr:response regulator [Clostridiaceae bacterium]
MLDLMVVDDDVMVVNDLIGLIDWEANGFNIVALAYNGKTAFEKFNRLKPDVVITDVVMPAMKGIDLLRQIKAVAPDTIVILISSYSEFAYVKEALDLGAFGYLLKDEISAESLQDLLSRVKALVQSEAISVSPLANVMFDRVVASSPQKPFFYMICEIDAPFPLAEIIGKERIDLPVFHSAEIQFVRDVVFEQVRVRHVFVVSDSRLILELSLNKKPGQHPQAREDLFFFAKYLQREFGDRFKRVVSFFLLNEPLDRQEVRSFYQRYEPHIYNRIFLGSGLLIDLTDERLNQTGSPRIPVSDELVALINEKNREKTIRQINNHFREIIDRRDYNGLIGFLESLAGLLEFFSLETGQSPLKIAARQESSKSVTNIEQCRNWINNEIEKLLDDLDAGEKYSRNVQKAIIYIRKNYADHDLGLSDIADSVGLSTAHLGFLFKKETGVTLNRFITKVRMENAMEMLRQTDCKMYDIAVSVGYRSSQYFSQVFTRQIGCTPKEYQRVYGKA